ncbi:multidrug transporter [Bacillus sp. AFS077874]|nr:multidrug transporter [Bacillus sp. AFS077874]
MNKLIGTKGMLDSYGISGKAETPQALAEEAKESRPMESEHPAVEINITLLLYENLVI